MNSEVNDLIALFRKEYNEKFQNVQDLKDEIKTQAKDDVRESARDLNKIFDDKMRENEQMLIRLQIKEQANNTSNDDDHLNELRKLKDKT